jgi:hypothetical protein
MLYWCPEGDLNPHDRLRSADFKSAVSADFTIRATNALAYRIAFSGRSFADGTARNLHTYLVLAQSLTDASNHADLRDL